MPTESINLYSIKTRIVNNFTFADWQEIGLLTGYSDFIQHHSRLLRSLNFGDDDYSGHVITVINRINREDPDKMHNIQLIGFFPKSTTQLNLKLDYSDYESEYLKLSEKDFGKKQLNDARGTMRFLLKFLYSVFFTFYDF